MTPTPVVQDVGSLRGWCRCRDWQL